MLRSFFFFRYLPTKDNTRKIIKLYTVCSFYLADRLISMVSLLHVNCNNTSDIAINFNESILNSA